MSTDAHASGPDERRPGGPGDEPGSSAAAGAASEQPEPAGTEPTGPTTPDTEAGTSLESESAVGGPEPSGPADVASGREPAPVEPAAPSRSTEPAVSTESTQPTEPAATGDTGWAGQPPEASEPAEASSAVGRSTDETHVAAIPAQSGDDPFSEVDGGPTPTPGESEPTTTFVPTPDEDDAMRQERARRFGRPQTEAEQPGEQTSGSTVPLAAAGAGAVATVGATGGASTQTQTMPTTRGTGEPAAGEEDPFKDFDEGPASRAAAHWWSILISVVFVPVSWYLIADGGERMSFNFTNGSPLNLSHVLELAAGALCLFFVLLAARWSSVGVIITGTISLLLGVAFIVFNDQAMELVAEYQGTVVQALDQLGQNIVDHLLRDAESGRIAIYGLALIMAGVISHGARRQGRREERRKAAIGL